MRLKFAVATVALLSIPMGSAMADTFWRNVLSSGATTGSTYLTFKDHKLIVAAQTTQAASSPATVASAVRSRKRPSSRYAKTIQA